MDATVRELLGEHERRFNEAVSSGDFSQLVGLFTEDAELVFVDLSAGPFVGREAIALAYATQPPDDGLRVYSVEEEADGTFVERFTWWRGGSGTMQLSLHGDRIARLLVAFD